MAEEKQKNALTKGIKAAWNWIVRYPVALVLSIALLAVTVILMMMGVGDKFNWGGILNKLFGRKKSTTSKVELANEIPEDRVDENDEPIPVGEPDEKGMKQVPVKVIDRSSNPFRDKSKLEVTNPEGEKEVIDLPTGVKDTDVEQVIQIQPRDFKVVVKKGPKKVSEDLVNKLGS